MTESKNEIQELIRENAHLFWWISDDKKTELGEESLVEAILNFGNEKSVKRLFDTIGLKKTAEIFFKQNSGIRSNYFPQTVHYFTLYFSKYAQ